VYVSVVFQWFQHLIWLPIVVRHIFVHISLNSFMSFTAFCIKILAKQIVALFARCQFELSAFACTYICTRYTHSAIINLFVVHPAGTWSKIYMLIIENPKKDISSVLTTHLLRNKINHSFCSSHCLWSQWKISPVVWNFNYIPVYRQLHLYIIDFKFALAGVQILSSKC